MKCSQTIGCKPSGQRKFNLRISLLNVIVKHYYEVSHTSRYRKLGSPACVLFIGLQQVSPCQMLCRFNRSQMWQVNSQSINSVCTS